MKKILITGANSYIGTSVENWLSKWPDRYVIDTVDMVGTDWEGRNFCGYDVIFHVAGIAHRNDAPDTLYEEVNHQLAVKVAEKAATEGVGQFILMSSGNVFSQSDRKHRSIVVNEESELHPLTAYGISKMRAEQDISKVIEKTNSKMKLVYLRPPFVYGPGAKGNYNPLAKFAKMTPICPDIKNQRSMIYIDNLCEFIRLVVDNESSGLFLPQNKEIVSTTYMIKLIAQCHGKKIWYTGLFNWAVYIASLFIDKINKVFGTSYYESKEYFDGRYQIVDFESSIKKSEGIV